jgi:hypothetical protein
MVKAHPKIERERKTLEAMIRIFCRESHGTKGEICNDCAGLLAYAVKRLDKCPFGAKKPTCANCPVHCYRPDMREQIRAVMRHAGPRMDLEAPGFGRSPPHRGSTQGAFPFQPRRPGRK